jgi:hypothetical protein
MQYAGSRGRTFRWNKQRGEEGAGRKQEVKPQENKAGSLTELRLEIAVKYRLSVSSFFQNLLAEGFFKRVQFQSKRFEVWS